MSVGLDIAQTLPGLGGMLFRTMSDAALVVDSETLHVAAQNAAAEQLFAPSASRVCGLRLDEVLSLPVSDLQSLHSWLLNSEHQCKSGWIEKPASSPISIEITTQKARENGRDWLIVVIRPTSDVATQPVEPQGSGIALPIKERKSERVGCWSWDAASGQVCIEPSLQQLFDFNLPASAGLEDVFEIRASR